MFEEMIFSATCLAAIFDSGVLGGFLEISDPMLGELRYFVGSVVLGGLAKGRLQLLLFRIDLHSSTWKAIGIYQIFPEKEVKLEINPDHVEHWL